MTQAQHSGTRRRAASDALALMMVLVAASVLTPPAQAQTFTVLHAFTGSPDGASPEAALLRDKAGDLYGTTFYGGDITCNQGCGTIFKIDTRGKETVLYRFRGSPDGQYPLAQLFMDAAGNLYGTTYEGGADNWGTVFKLDRKGKETLLHSFAGSPDAGQPEAGLIRDAAGNFYGTTNYGGESGYGTVFKMDASGNVTVLYSFTGGADGSEPRAALIRDAAGNLYGTTFLGGGQYPYGVVFKLDTKGKETVLYTFTGGTDGGNPTADLVGDAAGNLYGTTDYGGSGQGENGFGVIFELNKSGDEQSLYQFTGGADGADPIAGLVRDPAGNLYGTDTEGGAYGYGTLFELHKSGKLTLPHSFCKLCDGAEPIGDLIRDAVGNLYGTTAQGGPSGYGTVFKITPR